MWADQIIGPRTHYAYYLYVLRVRFTFYASPPLFAQVHEGAQELRYRGAQDDNEDTREDAEDHGYKHLDRGGAGALLGCLAAPDAHLVGLGPEEGADTHSYLLVLEHCRDE